jgi:ribosomal protein L11 methyltransferase
LDWLEFSVEADGEAAEAVLELFNRYGQGGAVVEIAVDCLEGELSTAPMPSVVTIKAYLPVDEAVPGLRRRLEEGLWHLGRLYPIPEPLIRELAEEDWANAWKRQYQPLRIGRKILIVPAWQAPIPESDRIIIQLEPGMAFGTGLHPTTRLCLEALESTLAPANVVLDVGTGSGVLAIAAAKLGARSVLALDADPVAVTVARENVMSNAVTQQITVQHGTLPGGGGSFGLAGATQPIMLDGGEFDLVVINILAPVIIGMAPALAARTVPGGRLIAAGLVEGQEADVVRALLEQDFQLVGRTQETDWVALVAKRGRSERLP